MRAEKPSPDRQIRDAEILLEQMSEEADALADALSSAERQSVAERLSTLKARAAVVATGADLLELTEGVLRLVEETPGLRRLLLPEGFDVAAEQHLRSVTPPDRDAARAQEAATRRAQAMIPQLTNAIEALGQSIDRALETTSADGGSDGGRGAS